MLSFALVGVGLLIGGFVHGRSVSRALVLRVALLNEPVDRGVDDDFGVPPVEPSGKPGLEELFDAVRPGIGVVAL